MNAPRVELPAALRDAITKVVHEFGSVEAVEDAALETRLRTNALVATTEWRETEAKITKTWKAHQHVVLKGLSATDDGSSAVVAALFFGRGGSDPELVDRAA